MRVSQRLIAATVLLALSGALAGCGGSALNDFDPTDMFNFLDTKKKLPGERRPVFPEGVPGVEQGVPKDLYKGAQEQQLQQQAPPVAEAAPAPPPQRSRPSRHSTARHAAPAPHQAEEGAPVAIKPTPAPKHKRTRITAPEPEQPAPQQQTQQQPVQQQQPAPQPQQQELKPFPAPLPSGSFQR